MRNKQENVEFGSKYSYQQYRELGGVINEEDYQSVLNCAQSAVTVDNKALIAQSELIAKKSGIMLHNSEDALDQRTVLYGILRTDTNPGEKYHHGQMSDQELFAEALRMLGDADSLKKLIDAHPNIFPPIKNE